ncbi:MAG: hypothetical protein CMJ40_08855 [Phycisphaerae bacterium]|nr:hypothetical protein [Phycisphaerae bacterium]
MDASASTSSDERSYNPLIGLLDLFSSVRFGILLLFLLFVYSAIGSAGLPLKVAIWEPDAWTAVRSWRGIEMTEYEWFNSWPFFILVGLTCLTIIVTTIRRIPFNTINLGVWMVHAGLIIMSLGCVFYFATKVEGDVPIARARIFIQPEGGEPANLRAMPGHEVQIETPDGPWKFQVMDTNPNWELLTGPDKGKAAYAVKVMVNSPNGMFIRQLLANYPEYTEDMVRSSDPKQPWARSVKQNGTALTDDTLTMRLEPDEQSKFWLMSSAALYLREVARNLDGSTTPITDWVERPIEDLPRYNEYVELDREVWLPTGDDEVVTGPLLLKTMASSPDDPLAEMPIYITSYLPYAGMETRDTPGCEPCGDPLNPIANLTLDTSAGQQVQHRMFAFDENPTRPDPSLMRFQWIDSESIMDGMLNMSGPRVRIRIPDSDIEITEDITQFTELEPDAPWIPVGDSAYEWRARRIDDEMIVRDRKLNLARIEMRNDNRTWLRWVFDQPALNGDFPFEGPPQDHSAMDRDLDKTIKMTYLPASGPKAPVTLVAGPEPDQLRLISMLLPGKPQVDDLVVGTPHQLGPDVTMTVTSYDARMRMETRPRVIEKRARQPRAGGQLSMIKIRMPEAKRQAWLTYHHYPFNGSEDLLRRFSYQPSIMSMPDGRLIEVMYSRQSAPLPSTVSLKGFDVSSHVGGFTGDVSSVLNWISHVRFDDDRGSVLSDVSVNNPSERNGYWYFQSQWDPPERATESSPAVAGLNYTILGVGNRNGVWTMLGGSVLSVIGMIYAFYIKPMIKRRRAANVYEKMKGAAA